jgi:hypothetical protein
MLIKLRTLGLCKAAFLLVASLFLTTAKAEIIQNDVIIIPSLNPNYEGRWLTIQSTPTTSGQGFFVFWIGESSPGSFMMAALGIVHPYGLYEAAPGDVLDAEFFSSHAPAVVNYFKTDQVTTLTFQEDETKLFAFWDAGFGGRPETYGWLHLTWTASGLSVSSSARAVGSGIIAATTTPVSEPASALLFLLGGAVGLIVRQRRQGSFSC